MNQSLYALVRVPLQCTSTIYFIELPFMSFPSRMFASHDVIDDAL